MVNRGASRGCITCKKRRVKCDETKPACKNCIQVRRECAGYGRQAVRLRFRDETTRYLHKPPHHATTPKTVDHEGPETAEASACAHRSLTRTCSHATLPGSPQHKQQDLAVAYFLTYVTDVGRNVESTRGFLEFVRPVLAVESHESALSAAVNATAVKLWALLRPSNVAASLLIHLHNLALGRLRQAVHNPTEKNREATVLAALMLQQHDTLAAVFDQHKGQSTHREGALALLTQKDLNTRNFKYHGHLLSNLFHSKISFCVRQKVPLTGSELDWLQAEVIPALPNNASSLLDVIGMSVSRLQSLLTETLSSQRDIALAALQELPVVICNVDTQLQAWLDGVPEFWRPRTIQRGMSIPSFIPTYNGFCDIYPSVQIANIWNTWRIYCLIVESVKLELTHGSQAVSEEEDLAFLSDVIRARHAREIQDLVASICRSIPFYLGNCFQPVSFSDIDNPQLLFPSYHDLPPTDEGLVIYKKSGHYASKIDHQRHVALHGPLHALSLLSNLNGLLSEDLWSILALDKQKQWINKQFHRSLHLMRFGSYIYSTDTEDSNLLEPLNHAYDMSPPAPLAQTISQALWTVSIL